MNNVTLFVEMFGGLRVHVSEPGYGEARTVSRFRTRATGALLAYIALSAAPSHSREKLIELFWPDQPLQTGRNNLSLALSALRRVLEPPGGISGTVLAADRHQVRLVPGAVQTDVARFEAACRTATHVPSVANLGAAAGLYRGELLEGFYEDWVAAERDRLARLFEWVRERLDAMSEGKPHRSGGGEPVRPVAAADEPAQSIVGVPSTGVLAAPVPDGDNAAVRPPLPLTLTRFFGREAEIARVSRWIAEDRERLVTLTGSAGMGKSRLSIETAARLSEWFEGAVWFVPLAEVRDASQLPAVVAANLCLHTATAGSSDGPPLSEQIFAYLNRYRRALLILDNVEQLLPLPTDAPAQNEDPPASADFGDATLPGFIRQLLSRVPSLQCVTTSRIRLLMAGEKGLTVGPLPAPPAYAPDAVEVLLGSPCVRLLVDRAQAVHPDFHISPRNAATLGAICRHLEGIPLAIELAAAWSGTLTPAQILSRLQDTRFGLLRARRGGGGLVPRHRSLRLALDASYDLLPAPIQTFFCRLAVFRGGWSLEACETILCEPLALDYLAYLRDASLVDTRDDGENSGGMRFFLLETMREYADEQQQSPNYEDSLPGTPPVGERHAQWYGEFAADTNHVVEGFRRLDADAHNLRVALEWGMTHRPEIALRLAAALGGYWEQRGYTQEGCHWLTQAIRHESTVPGTDVASLRPRSLVLAALGKLRFMEGEFAAAESLLGDALTLGRRCDDDECIATALLHQGVLAIYRGELGTADSVLSEASDRFRRTGDHRKTAMTLMNLGILAACHRDYARSGARWREAYDLARTIRDRTQEAHALCYLGESATFQSDHDSAHRFYSDALALARDMGSQFMQIYSLTGLARLANAQGDYERALVITREVLPMIRQMGIQWGIPYALDICAGSLSGTGKYEQAASLIGTAEGERERIGTPLPLPYQDLYRPLYDAARDGVGSAHYDDLRYRGRSLSLAAAFALAGVAY